MASKAKKPPRRGSKLNKLSKHNKLNTSTDEKKFEPKTKLQKLEEQKVALITRISGVSIPILKEQLQEEYLELEKLIAKERSLQDQYELMLWKDIISDSINTYKKYCQAQYESTDELLYAIETTNSITDLEADIKTARVRPVKSITDRRNLSILVQALNRRLVIRNIERDILDTIGIKKDNTVDWNLIIDTHISEEEYEALDKKNIVFLVPSGKADPFG